MQLRHAASTDVGRARDHNEDTFAIEAGREHADAGDLFVVCDGAGGLASGEVASELAATTISTRYYAGANGDPASALRAAFVEANERIFSRGHGKMGTTGVAALFLDDTIVLANVGDSRAYLIRDGAIHQLTRDHSFVAEQVAAGVLTEDQANRSSYRNVITRAIGIRAEVEVDLYRERASAGDRVLLCSDGLHGQVEPDELAKIASTSPLQRAVDALIRLANERGGPDNITAVLVEVVVVAGGKRTGAPAETERLAAAPEGTPDGATARVPTTAPRPEPRRRSPQPVQLRAASVAPPLAAPRPRRGPILGLIFMTLIGLALLGGVVWFLVNGGLAELTPPATPLVPSLTPVSTNVPGTGATSVPTFVPTRTPGPTPRR